MAIFSWSCRLVQRSKGHSVIEAAARCSSLRLYDARLGRFFDYHRKKPVVFRKLLLPEQAGKRGNFYGTLWKCVKNGKMRN